MRRTLVRLIAIAATLAVISGVHVAFARHAKIPLTRLMLTARMTGDSQPTGARAPYANRRLTQFHHTAWTVATGAPPDIWAIQQSRDGFLWLGTGAGLYRFDGIRFERIQPTSGDAFLSNDIVSLLALPSGDLWLGYQNGGASRLSGGRLTNFTRGLPPGAIIQLNVGRDGAIWAVAVDSYSGGSIGRFAGGWWERLGREWGVPETPVRGLAIDREGAVWLAAPRRLLRLRPGTRRFEPTAIEVMARAKLFRGPDDRLWSSDPVHGVRALPTNVQQSTSPPGLDAASSQAERLIFDRMGALWATSPAGGLFRVAPPTTGAIKGPLRKADLGDRFGLADGLSSDIARPLLEDREGDVWVGTNLGLDRFRAADIVAQADIPATSSDGYLAAFDKVGALYVTDSTSLRRIGADGAAHVVASGLMRPRAFCRRRDGSLWLASEQGLRRIDGPALENIAAPPEASRSTILSCQEDGEGVLWISVLGEGIFRRNSHGWSHLTVPGQPTQISPYLMIADRQGRMWLYYPGRPLVMIESRRVRRYGPAEGLDVGDIGTVYPAAGNVLVGGDHGIARFDGRRFQSLTAALASPLRRITGIAATARGQTWMNGIAGIVRVATVDLDAAFDQPGRTPHWQVFDFQDGVPGLAQQDSYTPTAIAARDGRVWFITNHGLAWIDPMALHRNPLPPPVVIRALRANGRDVAISSRAELAKGTSSLQVDYTALSLAVSERVRFRYRLDGVDPDWVDPGDRRQAFYTNLGPGSYRFHVIASNNDGVWNRRGATLDLMIPPTFLQSTVFKALCALALCGLLWLAYTFRIRQIAARMRARLHERLGERERIARELHDTLLQGFQGLVLRFQSVADRISPEQPIRPMLDSALDRADDVLINARDRIKHLRRAGNKGDLVRLLLSVADEFATRSSPTFNLTVEGVSRDLDLLVCEETARIGEEAIRNAFNHSSGKAINVAVVYLRRQLQLGICDDGVGMAEDIVVKGGREGHFGLVGMHERALGMQATLTVSSRQGSGTEVVLVVPGRVAYASKAARWTGVDLHDQRLPIDA